VIIREGEHLANGYLEGTIAFFSSPVLYWWDPSQDFRDNGVFYTAFRYRTYNQLASQSSCFLETGIGTEAILYFTSIGVVPTVTYPDEHIFLLPRSGQ